MFHIGDESESNKSCTLCIQSQLMAVECSSPETIGNKLFLKWRLRYV